MLRHPLFWIQFFTLAVVAGLHYIGISLEFYWSFGWYDVLVHWLGGFWVGCATVWFLYYSPFVHTTLPRQHMLLFAVGAALIAGVAWEIFELLLPVPPAPDYYIDTFVDLLMDGLGGAVSAIIATRIYDTA